MLVVPLAPALVQIGSGKLGVTGLDAPDAIGRQAFIDANLSVVLKREPSNAFDTNAILVFAHSRCPVITVLPDEPNVLAYNATGNGPICGRFDIGKRIGRLAKPSAQVLSPLIDGQTLVIKNVNPLRT